MLANVRVLAPQRAEKLRLPVLVGVHGVDQAQSLGGGPGLPTGRLKRLAASLVRRGGALFDTPTVIRGGARPTQAGPAPPAAVCRVRERSAQPCATTSS